MTNAEEQKIKTEKQEKTIEEILQEFDIQAEEVLARTPELKEAMQDFRALILAADSLSVEGAAHGFSQWITAVIVLATIPPYNAEEIEIVKRLAADAAQLTALMPSINNEVIQYKFTHKMPTIDFNYFVAHFEDDNGQRQGSLFDGLRDRATSMLAAMRGSIIKPRRVTLNLTKANAAVFSYDYNAHRDETETENVFELKTPTAYKDWPEGKEIPLYTYLTVDFRELGKNVQISKTLDAFDERVYAAVDALYAVNRRAGTEYVIVSATQIFRTMGGTGKKPSPKQKDRILESLNRLMFTRLIIDNTQEAENSSKYKLYPYNGNLLQADFLPYPCIINGKTVDQPIRLLATPPLMSYARARRQVARISTAAYQIGIRNDQQGLAITDYLLKFIEQKRHKKQYKFNIIVETLFQHLGIGGKMLWQRALYGVKGKKPQPARIPAILDHFKDVNIILDYKIFKDEFKETKIEITLSGKE